MVTRRRLLAALGVLVVVVVGIGAYVFVPRGTNEVSVEDAVGDFRAGSTRPGDAAARTATGLPTPGVYSFAASGEEVVKLGPLPAQTRPLPATVTAVAQPAAEGCFEWTVNLFAEHAETTTYCLGQSGLVLRKHLKHQKIGALSPTASMTCETGVIPMESGSSTRLDCTMELSGGPLSVTSQLAGTAVAGDQETLRVGAAKVEATPVRVEYRLSGDLTGTWFETTWWSPDHLPVRVERSLDIAGLATFTERSRLDLTGLRPAS